MDESSDRRFYLNSIGLLYKKSLAMFAEKLEDAHGNNLEVDHIQVNEKFFAYFASGTGMTRTSGERIC